jgi:hypothetical protein
MVLDLDGEVSMDAINDMLVRDPSPVSRDLRAKLIAENGPNEFLLVLCDCLREHLRTGVTEDRVLEQVRFYLEA